MRNVLLPALLLAVFGFFSLLEINQPLAFTQLIYITAAVLVYCIAKSVGVRFFRINHIFFYWLFIGILVVTYLVGLEAKGSRRWIDLYFFNFQASEAFKIIFIIFLAQFFSTLKKSDDNLINFAKALLFFLFPTLIIFKQPDLGNALVFGCVFVVMTVFSVFSKKNIAFLMLVGLMLMPVGWLTLKNYQRQRLVSFIQPHADLQGVSYNMNQAMITIGSGGFWGKGMGLGTQSKLFFLPENHTDFAFSSLIEQFGFLGGTALLLLFFWLISLIVRRLFAIYKHKHERNSFAFFYHLGFLTLLFFQIFINIGMNLGILPIAGITLPYISYGGSSLLAIMFGLAFL